MNKTRIIKHRRSGVLITMAAIAFAMILPRLALAANASGPLTHTEYLFQTTVVNGTTVNNPQILLQLNGNSGVNYFAQPVSPGCAGTPALDMDTIKIWMSLAQAAQLSGKSTIIYYTVCGGLNYINDVVMFN